MLTKEETVPSQRAVMSGDEAVARGAAEAGVQFVASYPGTPATEMTTTLARYGKELGFHVEWSANEKVAFEAAYAASLAGRRSLVGTKHLGMNVLSDSLLVGSYAGVRGGMVIAVADDTHPFSSQNAMDSRYYALLTWLPCFEPSSPREAKNLVKLAFDVSEEFSLPVIVRLTLRLAHGNGSVELGEVHPRAPSEADFVRDKERFVLLSRQAYQRKKWLIQQTKAIKNKFESSGRVVWDQGKRLAIIATGVGVTYSLSVVQDYCPSEVKIMQVWTANPLPEKSILDIASQVEDILVMEDGDPIVERGIRNILQAKGLVTKVHGQDDGTVESLGELTAEKVIVALSKLGIKIDAPDSREQEHVIPRVAALCAGCPHRASYFVIKDALAARGGGIVSGDRGCYNQGANFPLEAFDTCMDMGASIGIAYGLSKAGVMKPIVAVIGDSTFFHAGMPALANAVVNGAKMTVAILDNRWTSMTGQQPGFTTGKTLMEEEAPRLSPERVASSLGVEFVKVVDPFDVDGSRKAMAQALDHDGVSVVVFRRECTLQELRRIRRSGERFSVKRVDQTKCTGCKVCLVKTGCPALKWDESKKKMMIDPNECTGCGLCTYACEAGAIVPKEGERSE